jgi:hypothetical protein
MPGSSDRPYSFHKEKKNNMVTNVSIEVRLPAGFSENYRHAVIRSTKLCAVAKPLENPPTVAVTTVMR